MFTKKDKNLYLVLLVIILVFTAACNLILPVFKDTMSLIIKGKTPVPLRTQTPEITKIPSAEVILMSEEGTQADAAHCDAIDYVDIISGKPEEKTKDNGSYWCFMDYSFTNTHPKSNIVISWKHSDSSLEKGPYWTHPRLGPGDTYNTTQRSNKAANGKWTTVDGDFLMAWFATEACDRFTNEYWPTEAEPDRLLASELKWVELDNPCMP